MLRMILLLTALLTVGLASTAVASPNTRNARSNANLERVDGTMMLIIRSRRGGTAATNEKGTTAYASSGETVTVLVDGILMEMPRDLLIALIRMGVFEVVGEAPLDITWMIDDDDDDED